MNSSSAVAPPVWTSLIFTVQTRLLVSAPASLPLAPAVDPPAAPPAAPAAPPAAPPAAGARRTTRCAACAGSRGAAVATPSSRRPFPPPPPAPPCPRGPHPARRFAAAAAARANTAGADAAQRRLHRRWRRSAGVARAPTRASGVTTGGRSAAPLGRLLLDGRDVPASAEQDHARPKSRAPPSRRTAIASKSACAPCPGTSGARKIPGALGRLAGARRRAWCASLNHRFLDSSGQVANLVGVADGVNRDDEAVRGLERDSLDPLGGLEHEARQAVQGDRLGVECAESAASPWPRSLRRTARFGPCPRRVSARRRVCRRRRSTRRRPSASRRANPLTSPVAAAVTNASASLRASASLGA